MEGTNQRVYPKTFPRNTPSFGGDGRTRTAVQTPHQTAFYTLSLTLIFDYGLPSDRLSKAYPLNLSGT